MKDLYNIALDCIDKNGQSLLNKNKTALISIQGDPQSPQAKVTQLSFSALMGLTNRMANTFQKVGISPGERVLIRLPNCPEFPISFLGAIKFGAIPIPTFPLYKWNELNFLLKDSQASTLITSAENLPPECLQKRPNSLKNIILLLPKDQDPPKGTLRWQDLLKESAAKFITEETKAEDPAYWLYTSGTTGEPKAVIHAHRSIPAHDERVKLWQNAQQGDIIFNTSSLNWSYSLTAGLLDIWRHGLTSVIYQGDLTAENLTYIVRRFGVTIFMSVPGLYGRLASFLKEHPGSFEGVRVCLSAGENLRPETRKKFQERTGLDIYEGLGMTEHSAYLVQRYGEKIPVGSCGRPLPSQRIGILQEDLTETPVGETGTLATHRSCQGLMLGYRDSPEEKTFSKEWFLSGDLAYRDEEGNYFFMGRRDDVITAGGYRISPLEVEKVLNQHPAIQEAAVIGKTLPDEKTIVQAYIVLEPGKESAPSLEKDLIAYAENHLANYKVPRKIIFLNQLPKTSTGKLKRRALP